jgi:hypothetical protein
MKNIILFSALLFVVGCRLDDTITNPVFDGTDVSLGVPSKQLAVNGIPGPLTSGLYEITVNVTPGAMYSFQLTHINGTILNNYGFTANASQMTITLNYSNVVDGAYDLNLMDNTGRVLKIPVIVKH